MAVLDVHDLRRSYRAPDGTSHLVVDVPRFSLEAGAQVALAGHSGSGKTTFLNLLAGILQPDSGRVLVAGRPMSGQSEAERDRLRATALGYIFQTFNLLQGYTALENVELAMLFGRGLDREFAAHLLERVGLRDRMHYRPGQLSVGQQQRVAVARALANHPQVVLADEPTGNLDRRTAIEALNLIRELCRENEAGLLLVSHDADVLGQFERSEQFADINRALRDTQSVAAGPASAGAGAGDSGP